MSGEATGVATQLRLGKESAWGTPPAAGSGRLVRRKTCDLVVGKDAMRAMELLPHNQRSDVRHGLVRSTGTLNTEPAPGAHSDLFASCIRAAFATGATTGAIVTVTAAAGPPGTFTRAGGSFLTDGFKLGDIVRWTGWATTGTANNNRNYIITALTATVMTVADVHNMITSTVAAKASGDSVTCTVYGKTAGIPNTGHTDESYAFERYYGDIVQSEMFTGVKVNGFSLKLAAGSMGDLTFNLLGGGYINNTSAYYTSPTAVSTTPVLAASNGGLLVAGGATAYVRELSIVFKNGITEVPVAFSNTIAGLTQGTQEISGSLVAYFKDAVMRDYFLNEAEPGLIFYNTSSPSLTADFIQCAMPRIKLMSQTRPDGPGVIAMSMTFEALYNGAGGATVNTRQAAFSMQDSLAA